MNAPQPAIGETFRILVADDDPAISRVVVQVLEYQGYSVHHAGDGEQALRSAASLKPDLIILDVNMPKMSGYEVCRNLKSNPDLKPIPVLILTVLDNTPERVKGLDSGADDFIHKPFNPEELIARVRAFLRTKRLHDELQDSYRRLKELESYKDGLTSMLIHDLKAPLNVLSGTVQFFMDEYDEKAHKVENRLLRNAEDNCRSMVGLINDLLDVSRLEQKQLPLKKEKCPMDVLLRGVMEKLSYLAERHEIRFTLDLPAEPLVASVDSRLIERVFTNLISNSIKFMDPGGEVKVSGRVTSDGKSLVLMVEDSGIGIPPENIEKIFDKFFQGKGLELTRKGQGLGLTFCKMVSDAHGGRIWAENRQEGGSRFSVQLPL